MIMLAEETAAMASLSSLGRETSKPAPALASSARAACNSARSINAAAQIDWSEAVWM